MMGFYSSTTFRFALWLSVGAILVMGAAPKNQDDSEFNEDHYQQNHRPNHRETQHEREEHPSARNDESSRGNGGNLIGQVTNSITSMTGADADGLAARGGSAMEKVSNLAGKVSPQSALGMPANSMDDKRVDPLEPAKDVTDVARLITCPLELVKHISTHFNVPLDKLIEKIGPSVVIGLEALLQPPLACIKIIEKVFKPDDCRLKFVCKLGSNFHSLMGGGGDKLIKISPIFLGSSLHLKALSEGLAGKDCELIYSGCGETEPKLKKSFEELKQTGKSDYKGEDAAVKQAGGARGLAGLAVTRQPISGARAAGLAGSKQMTNSAN